ncbi:MAG: DUF4159 domain-containing protein [Candidatus Eiseniibacteriota bacterium]|jgi:hypothetical protein
MIRLASHLAGVTVRGTTGRTAPGRALLAPTLLAALALGLVASPAPTGAQVQRRQIGSAPQKPTAPSGVTVARLRYGGGGDWYSNPSSLPNLMRTLAERTTVPVESFEEQRVSLLDDELYDYPFIYMNGHGNVQFTAEEVERLREYLTAGGFLFADDNYGMDRSFRREMRRVFPEQQLVEVPFDHPIYHSYYEIPAGPPKVHEHDGKRPQGLGIFQDGRLVVYYTYESDVGDGIEDPDVHHDPPDIREAAMRMAINVVVYALTS